MKNYLIALVFLLPLSVLGQQRISDEQIKHQIIQSSIARYPGNCPCPYSTARNGSQCGGRSAYSKPGGYSPVCYPHDVTQAMINDYKRTKGMQ